MVEDAPKMDEATLSKLEVLAKESAKGVLPLAACIEGKEPTVRVMYVGYVYEIDKDKATLLVVDKKKREWCCIQIPVRELREYSKEIGEGKSVAVIIYERRPTFYRAIIPILNNEELRERALASN